MKSLKVLLFVSFLVAVAVIVESAHDVMVPLQMPSMRPYNPRPAILMRRTDTGDADALAELQSYDHLVRYPGPAQLTRRDDSEVRYCTYNAHCDGWKADAVNKCVCVHPEENSIIGRCVCGDKVPLKPLRNN